MANAERKPKTSEQLRYALISRAQDVAHYFAAVAPKAAGFESTFCDRRDQTLRGKLENYESGRIAFIECFDIGRQMIDLLPEHCRAALPADQDPPSALCDVRYVDEITSEAELKREAAKAYRLFDRWMKALRIRAYDATDLTEKES